MLQILWELQVCKLQEQLENTIQKLEESKQLLKTNENGRFVQLDFSLCKNDPLISLVLKWVGVVFGVFVKSCHYCHVWKTNLWLCNSQELQVGIPLGLVPGAVGCVL